MNKGPDYQKIYKEITERFHKNKTDKVKTYLQKEEWTSFDVIAVNKLLYDMKENNELKVDKRCKAYDEQTIISVLNHQKEFRLNNSELSRLFKISRNSVISWRKRHSN